MLTTLGLFPTTAEAEEALSLWLAQELDSQQVSIIVQKRIMLLHMAQYDRLDQVQHSGIIRRAPLDHLAGMLVGIGATAVPGLGSVLAAGPLTVVVAKALGGLTDALERVGLPAKAAIRIRDGLRQGQVLLALHDIPDGPVLMSIAQAIHQYHYRLQLASSPDPRLANELEHGRDMQPTVK